MAITEAALKELIEKRQKKLAEARAYHEAHKDEWGSAGENGTDPGEHEVKYRALMAEQLDFKATIDREHELREAEKAEVRAELGGGDSEPAKPTDPNAKAGDGAERAQETGYRERKAAMMAERRSRGLHWRDIDEWMARQEPLSAKQEADLNAVLQYAVANNAPQYRDRIDFENVEKRALQADLDVSGGNLVAPVQWLPRLIQAVDNMTFFPSLATVIPVTSSDSLGAPSLDTDPAAHAWTAEIGAVSEDSTMAFGGRELVPHQLTKLIKVSEKLLMVSAIPVEPLVRNRLAYVLAITLENVYLNGTGAGQPLGVFTASAQGISTSRDVNTDMGTAAVTVDGLKSCRGTLLQQYRARANWIAHRDFETQVAKLKDGEGNYLWQQSIQAGDPDRLLGFPLRLSEYAPNTFTSGLYVAILGDFSHYWIAVLQNAVFQRLNELYIANGQIGFRHKGWWDGMPTLEEAFVRATLA